MMLAPIDSLRKIPDGWELRRLKFVVDRFYSGGTPSTGNAEYWNGDFPWVSSKDMKCDKIVDTEDHLTALALEESNLRLLPPGQLLLVVRSGILRHTIPVAINSVETTVNQDIKALALSEHVLPDFLRYIVKGMEGVWLSRWRKQGTTVESLEYDFYANDFIPIPPPKIQSELVGYLDKRCHEIDDLIAKKRGMLKLLAEKRSALITRAVTKGPNPNAAMKPTGIDWLGDIPEHWDAISFKWRCKIPSGQVNPTEEAFAKLPLIAPDFIESGTGILDTPPSAEEQGAISGKYHFPANTVVYSKIRPLLAKVCISPFEALCSADMYPIEPHGSIDSEYLFFQLLSGHFTSFAVMESLRVAMPKVNRETLGAFPILVPPLQEQAEIVAEIKSCIDEIDASRKLIECAIEQLGEYRSAIITKAVTGELKVA